MDPILSVNLLRVFLSLVALGCGLAGCNDRNIATSELVGNYAIEGKNNMDFLELRADGTYLHIFRDAGKEDEIRNEGRWTKSYQEPNDRFAGTNEIRLDHFIVASCFYPDAIPAQFKGAPANASGIVQFDFMGNVRLLFAENGYSYVKQKQLK